MGIDPWAAWTAAAAWPWPSAASSSGFGDLAGRFQAAAAAFLKAGAAATGSGAPAGGAAAFDRDTLEAFSRFLRQQCADLRMPWSVPSAGMPPPGSGFGAPDADVGPVGATREHQARAQRLQAAGQRLLEAQQRLQLLWSDALREAATAFTAQLASEPPAEPTPDRARALYDRWIDCAEDAYNRSAHSQAYCDAFAEFINAEATWRQEWQAGIEQWAKMVDLPTRAEFNSLLERVEVLSRAQRAARKGAASTAGSSRARTRRAKPAP